MLQGIKAEGFSCDEEDFSSKIEARGIANKRFLTNGKTNDGRGKNFFEKLRTLGTVPALATEPLTGMPDQAFDPTHTKPIPTA